MLIFGLVAALSANLLTGADPDIKSTLERYVGATVHFDVPALDRVLSPQYVEVSPLGEVDPRDRVLGFYNVPPDKRPITPKSFKVTELSVRHLDADVAVAVFREDLELVSSGKTLDMSFRVTSVLHREGGLWRIFSNQANGIRLK